jgi:hypothetical protein
LDGATINVAEVLEPRDRFIACDPQQQGVAEMVAALSN